MKQIIRYAMFLMAVLLLPVAAFCQEVAELTELTEFDPVVYFVSLSALVAGVMSLTEFIKRLVKSSGKWTKYLSWFVSFGLSFTGWFLELGIFVGIEWYWVVAYGLAAGLVSNSIFDLSIVKGILSTLQSKYNA